RGATAPLVGTAVVRLGGAACRRRDDHRKNRWRPAANDRGNADTRSQTSACHCAAKLTHRSSGAQRQKERTGNLGAERLKMPPRPSKVASDESFFRRGEADFSARFWKCA